MFLPVLFFLVHHKQSKAWQSLSMLGFFLSPFTVFLTASRNGFVTLVVVLALILFQKRSSPKLWAFLLIMVLLILIAPGGYWQRISTIPRLDVESGLSLKISHLQRGLEIIKANPLFGIGLGKLTRAIHNTVLQVAVEVGLPAVLIFLTMIYLAFKELKRVERFTARNVHLVMFSRLPWMVIVGLIAYLIGGLTVSYNLMLPFYIMLGLITAMRNLTLLESQGAKITG
jgi:O-antigen ligase